MNSTGVAALGISLLLLLSDGMVMAEEEVWSPSWNLTVGGKGVYGSGVSEANMYYMLFGEGSLDLEYLELSAKGSRYLGYQVTDGLGTYDYVNIGEGSLRGSLKPWSFLSLGGEYRYAEGDSSYERRDWSCSLRLGPDDFYLEGEYGAGITEYLFGASEIEIKRADTSLSLSRDVSDAVSMEIGYDRNELIFSSLDYEYTKQTLRLGAMFDVAGTVFILAGISGGGDSEDYAIAGGDAGVVAVIYSHVKISAVYLFEQYIAPSTSTSTGKGGGGTSGSANPFLSSDKIGESYSSHRFSVGASISLN